MASNPQKKQKGKEIANVSSLATAPLSQTFAGGGGQFEGGYAIPPIRVTHQDEILLHQITDDQLTRLATGHSSGDGLFFTLLGTCIAAAPTTFTGISNAYFAESAHPLQFYDLLHVITFAICFAFCLYLGPHYKKNREKKQTLVGEIRGRK